MIKKDNGMGICLIKSYYVIIKKMSYNDDSRYNGFFWGYTGIYWGYNQRTNKDMDITGISNHNHWDRRYLGIYSQFMASMAKVSMSGSPKRTVLWGLWLGVWWGISGNGDCFFVDSWDIMGHRDMINNSVIQCKTNDIQFGADGSKIKWPFVLLENHWFFGYHI